MVAEMLEGRQETIQHLRRECQPALVRNNKAFVLKETGRLACEGCGFVYAHHYGRRGSNFIECHHTRFVSELSPDGEKTDLADPAIICANCHRMIHTRSPWLTIGDPVALVSADRQ